MSQAHFHLSGRVTRSDNGQGVFGLRVEAWDAACPGTSMRGFDLTGRDGSYHIDLSEDESACCDCPKVYIVVRDRDCRLVHDGCADRRCCQSGQALVVDVVLAPAALWWHLARPLAWAPIDEALVPVRVMQEIEDAIELLRDEGLPPALASTRLAVCATPPLEGFDRVLHDAWGALQGDLEAARRYREILQTLCGGTSCCDSLSPFTDWIDDAFAEDDKHPVRTECVPPEPCSSCAGGCGCAECGEGCACGTPFISRERSLLLFAAALHVACGDEAAARRHVLVLLEQLGGFETLGALHAASLKALLGDAASKAHVRDLLEWLCARCGGGERSACIPRRPPGCATPCLDEGLACCLSEMIGTWCRIHCWRVCEVRPPRACPGEEILLVGCGFGHRRGRVVFRGGGDSAPLQGRVTGWCDDRISVVVPPGAGCGLTIELPPRTIALCGRFLELRPTGCIEQGFEGTSAQILRFDIRGHVPGGCPLQPGEPLRIRWNTCAADRVRVELIDLADNRVVAVQDPAAPNGRWDFDATRFQTTVRLRVLITAFGRCDPAQVSRQVDLVFQRRPDLQVQGLEITQAVQHYRADQHLTDPADRGPDNSLRLVTGKTAWVRAYLRSGQDPAFDNGQLAGVTGTLRVERRVAGVWSTLVELAPQNAPVTAEDSFASYAAERGNINTTLNFVVPRQWMSGLLRFTVEARGPFAPCPGHLASRSAQVDVNLQQTLNAAFITIGYNGPNAARTGNIVLPAPSLADCLAETSWALTTYPVSATPNVRAAGTFVTATPIDDPRSCPGCCSPNWGPLLTQVAALVALDQAANPGVPWVYYGLIASGIPVNVPGCSGVATGGVAGQPVTYAHEIGHQLGLPHARCGNAGSGNPNYPVYEPYDLPADPPGTTNWTMASIGEYGLDINSGAIADPNTFEDFMSYCGPRWISKFTHEFLTDIAELSPVEIPSGAAAAPRVIADPSPGFEPDTVSIRPLILLLGTFGTDGSVDVLSVARLDTRYLPGDGRPSGYRVQHLGADGRVLAEDVLYVYAEEGGCAGRPPSKDCHCDDDGREPGPLSFKAMLPDTAPGASLRILRRGEVVWERRGSNQPPRLRDVGARLLPGGDLELAWRFDTGATENAEVWVRWTADDGRTWHALAVGLRGGVATIPAAQLPAGELSFEMLAHDGFHTVRARTGPVSLPARPPAVAILHPADGARVYADRRIHLLGTASSHGGGAIEDDAAEWFIDDKPVGRGFDLWVDQPGVGRHTLRLVVQEGEADGVAEAVFEVTGGDDGPVA